MFSWSSQNYFTILSFSRRVIAPESSSITLNGVPKTFIFMMLINRPVRKLSSIMIFLFLSFAGRSSRMKEKFSVSVVDIKIMYAVTGCSSMTTISKNWWIRVHFFSGDLILLLSIPKEVLFSLSEVMTQRASTLLVKSTIFKTTRGVESPIWTLLETPRLPAFSTTSTFMFSLAEPNSTRKRSPTQLKCMILITTCGAW